MSNRAKSSAQPDVPGSDATSSTSVSKSRDEVAQGISAGPKTQNCSPKVDAAAIVLWLLVGFRLINAFTIRTFFQPDEYFQALEPAWYLVFGEHSGAWMTWVKNQDFAKARRENTENFQEWRNQLRSTLHPYLFAAIYWSTNRVASILNLTFQWRAEALLAAPKVLQGFLAAIADYYTWKIGKLVYGEESHGAWICLSLSILNPFHFFIITRTLSNCLELVLSIAALYYWFTSAPDATSFDDKDANKDAQSSNKDLTKLSSRGSGISSSWTPEKLGDSAIIVKRFLSKQMRAFDLNRLRLSLLLAAIACTLRVTNILTWTFLACFEFFDFETTWQMIAQKGPFKTHLPLIKSHARNLTSAHWVLVRESVVCGSVILLLNAALDRSFYGHWTFPPAQFLYFNIAEGVANFYGVSDWTWYFTQGLPMLLGTYLPFAFQTIRKYLLQAPIDQDDFTLVIKYEFANIVVLVPLVFSFVPHKEVRFIYPLLPILHVLVADSATKFLEPILLAAPFSRKDKKSLYRYSVLFGVIFMNCLVAFLTSRYHQCAPLSVLDYLRHEHEAYYLSQPPAITGLGSADTTMTVGFLMPCHSTPWRSHLVYPDIKAWALGCEPPLDLPSSLKATYKDEADQFYDQPEDFLWTRLGRPAIRGSMKSRQGSGIHGEDEKQMAWDGRQGKKLWPDYLVFFAEKEQLLSGVLRDSDYMPCWRGWNSWFHDDWRRRGDVIVWCRQRPLSLVQKEGLQTFHEDL